MERAKSAWISSVSLSFSARKKKDNLKLELQTLPNLDLAKPVESQAGSIRALQAKKPRRGEPDGVG